MIKKWLEGIKEILKAWYGNKLYFLLMLFSTLLLGSSLQYNWALEHNFWKDFPVRITLGGPIISILFFGFSSVLIYQLERFELKTINEYIKKISISTSVFALSGIIFFAKDFRFKIFVILFVLFIMALLIFFKKEFSEIVSRIFPNPPCKLDYNETSNEVTIKLQGVLTKETINHLYDSMIMEEEGLPEKKIVLDLRNLEEVDKNGFFWIMNLVTKVKMANQDFEIQGEAKFSFGEKEIKKANDLIKKFLDFQVS